MSDRDLNLDRQNTLEQRNTASNANSESNQHSRLKESSIDKTFSQAEIEQVMVARGLEAENQGRLKQAIAHYQQALERVPDSFQARQQLTTAIMKYRHQNRDEIMTEANNSAPSLKSVAAKISSSTNIEASSNGLNAVNLTSQVSEPQLKTDFTNLGLVHRPISNSHNLESASPQSNKFVLLPDRAAPTIPPEKISAAEVYVSQAVAYFEQQRWSESIAACQEALRVNPNGGAAYKIWGNSLQRSGQIAEAIGLYAKALEANANPAEIYCNLGSIYAKQKKRRKAVEHYEKSIAADSTNPVPYRNLARVWDELEEYDKSAECFFKAINIKPNLLSASNHFNLANNLITEGNTKQAIACYKNCIELEPGFLNAYARLADALEQSGHTEEALFYYKQLARLQTEADSPATISKSAQQISTLLKPAQSRPALTPAKERQKMLSPSGSTDKALPQLQPAPAASAKQSNPSKVKQQQAASIHGKNGDLCVRNQEWQAAIAHYRQATSLAPHQASYHLKLGRTWERINNYPQANLAFFAGFSLSPQKVTAQNHYLLGDKLLKQNETDKAVVCYRRAVSIQPNLIEAYWRMGEIAMAKGNYKTALSCYRRALKIDPNRPQNYILLGNTLSQQGDWKGALAYHQRAETLEPDNADIGCNIGECLTNLQRYDEADLVLRRTIGKHPQYWKTYFQLGKTLSQQKQWQEAVGALEKALIFNNNDFGLTYHHLGRAFAEQKQWQEAVDAYKKAVELDRDSAWSFYGLGSALCELGQWNAAAEALEKSLELNPGFDWAYHKLGNAKTELQDWNGAVSAYRRALEITPNLPKTESKLHEALRQRSAADLAEISQPRHNMRHQSQKTSLFDVLEELPEEPEVYLNSFDKTRS